MTKSERYEALLPQIFSLIDIHEDRVSVLANVSSVLHHEFGWWWTGFYLVKPIDSKEQLVLGPFQGPVACYRIGFGRGVCGTAWKERQTQVVSDVDQFPGHIACSSESRSEIVVPIYDQTDEVVGVLDIDSRELATFDAIDQKYLEQVATQLSRLF